MVNGNLRPHIGQANVRSVLESMLYGRVQQPNPLTSLLLVDVLLNQPDVPLTDDPRTFAIKYILVDLIAEHYQKHRWNLGLSATNADETLQDAYETIREAGRTQNQELLGWCVLFYRYVRVTLNLSPEMISQAMGVEDRTLRRYHTHALQRLTEALVEAEWRARQQQRRIRLHTSLPITVAVQLIGREADFNRLQNLLDVHPPHHIQITGAAGVGKTVLVQETIRQQIDDEQIDYLVWIDDPPSPDYVLQHVQEVLGLEGRVRLKAFTLENRLSIVLDNVEWSESTSVVDAFNSLSGATVYLISRTHLPFLLDFKHVLLGELDQESITQIVRGLTQEGDGADPYPLQIWQMVGGNPLAAKMATWGLKAYDVMTLDAEILAALFDRVYQSLDDAAQRAWIAFALMPLQVIYLEQLIRTWSGRVEQRAVFALIRSNVVEFDVSSQNCSMTMSGRRFIQGKCESLSTARLLLEDLLHTLEQQNDVFEVIEFILLTGWPKIDDHRYAAWVKRWVKDGIQHGHYAAWLTILKQYHERLEQLDVVLQIKQGVCLRHLSEWQQAEAILASAVQAAGEQGLFAEQGDALLELGILLRLQGQYTEAERLFEGAYRAANRFSNNDLRLALQLERAQMAVDQRDGEGARNLVVGLPLNTRVLALQAEAQLLLGDSTSAAGLAQQAIAFIGENPRFQGRLHDLIGRIYEQQGDVASAERFFALAVTLLEQEEDFAGLARARANLGAVLLRQQHFRESYDLLTRAESMLLWLGDRAALLVVRHNLNILRRRIAG
jgi:tetratricopeptide (TPR) repeat protein